MNVWYMLYHTFIHCVLYHISYIHTLCALPYIIHSYTLCFTIYHAFIHCVLYHISYIHTKHALPYIIHSYTVCSTIYHTFIHRVLYHISYIHTLCALPYIIHSYTVTHNTNSPLYLIMSAIIINEVPTVYILTLLEYSFVPVCTSTVY